MSSVLNQVGIAAPSTTTRQILDCVQLAPCLTEYLQNLRKPHALFVELSPEAWTLSPRSSPLARASRNLRLDLFPHFKDIVCLGVLAKGGTHWSLPHKGWGFDALRLGGSKKLFEE